MSESQLNIKNGSHIVVKCPLCSEKGLHIISAGSGEDTRQCLNCGYVTAPRFKLGGLSKFSVPEFNKLTSDMREWAKEADDFIWIPTIMTLPFGMLYPFNDEKGDMVWGYSDMIDIPEEQQKNYPVEGKENEFYKSKYDTDNQIVFLSFLEGMSHINNKVKELQEGKEDA
tara:strand:+ start:646 stop:1155 length:510 start_codon:yes stop_codon:yes gene_type:complete